MNLVMWRLHWRMLSSHVRRLEKIGWSMSVALSVAMLCHFFGIRAPHFVQESYTVYLSDKAVCNRTAWRIDTIFARIPFNMAHEIFIEACDETRFSWKLSLWNNCSSVEPFIEACDNKRSNWKARKSLWLKEISSNREETRKQKWRLFPEMRGKRKKRNGPDPSQEVLYSIPYPALDPRQPVKAKKQFSNTNDQDTGGTLLWSMVRE